jgi:hypothetical protein
MKNLFNVFSVRLFGIIVLVAIIGFSFAACGGGDDGTIGGTSPTITTASLPDGTVGTVYNQTLVAIGDIPITWNLESGTLPTGLIFTGNVISGTPTTAGKFDFSVKAINSTGSATKQLSITIITTGGDVSPWVDQTIIQLTENTWEDGNLTASSDVQWFKFTATASTQYIHVNFGTLASLSVQVYDSSGATVGSQKYLGSTTTYVSQSVTGGQEYYIKVFTSSSSGTYKIGFNSTFYSPGTTINQLTENTWADGNLPTSSDVQWFKFTATASTQYIHASFNTLTQMYVQLYDSSGATVGSRQNLSGSKAYVSQSVTSGQEYYIKVLPYSTSYSGIYKIGFNTTFYSPGTTITQLTENTWENGNLPTSSDVQWFKFNATASTQYIYAYPGTLNYLYVQLYDSSGATVGIRQNLSGTTTYISQSVTSGQEYYIKVWPFTSSGSGTYKIGFNTTSTTSPPGAITPPSVATQLTLNTSANGNISTEGGEEWFKFTATANTQYIRVSFNTLNSNRGVYVQLYDSSGAAIGGQTNLFDGGSFGGQTYVSLSVTSGQLYYIKVWPSSSSDSGTYQIRFTNS